jgi:LPS-assembly protein
MRKLLAYAMLLLSTVEASKLEVISTDIDSNATVIKANNDVNFIYGDTMIASDEMCYDKNSSVAEFKGNIQIHRDDDMYLLGENLKLDLKSQEKSFEPLFIHEKRNNFWFSAKSAQESKGVYKLQEALISSCNPVDPEWKIAYSSGEYNSTDKWADLYNVVVYAGNIPLLYTPYFGFSTDTTRRTGFLVPTVGISGTEGFVYEQPYYIVPSDGLDIELRVQNRTARGHGAFVDFRFVDSPYGKGSMRYGYFKETNDNQDFFGWTHREHYGGDIDYERTHLFDKYFFDDVTDKFFTDIKVYNDIDYVNLQSDTTDLADTSTVLTSRVNYMLAGESQYLGVYAKYFFDTTAETTTETLQELPKVQYHKYIDNFILDNLIYSLDYKVTSRSRINLTSAFENVVTAPISYRTSLFDNYINVSFTEDIAVSNINFNHTDGNTSFETGNYVSLAQTLKIDTDIMKKYEENTHALRFAASYVFPGTAYKSGFYENKEGQFDDEECTVGELCEFVQGSIDPIEKSVDLELTQYLFDKHGKEWMYHKMVQPINVENNVTFGVFENELRIKLTDNMTLYNNAFYDAGANNFDKVSTSFSYNGSGIDSILTHLLQDQADINKVSNYLTFKFNYKPGNNYIYTAEYAYDNLTHKTRNILAGVKMEKRCWSYGFQFSQRVIPTSSASLTEQYLSFRVELLPIAGVGYEHQLSSESE